MDINKVCLISPEVGKTPIEQCCSEANIEVSRLDVTGDLSRLKDTDLLIDRYSGDMNLKKNILEKANEIIPEKTILASTPLLLSLTQIAFFAKRPDKVIGILPPLHSGRTNFVEIIVGIETSEETQQSITQFLRKIGFTCTKSSDSAGFVLNRVLASMINEATNVVMYGLASVKEIDQMMKLAANFPSGPFEFADAIGIDIIVSLLRLMAKELGPKYRPCPLLVRKVEAGHLGKKSGRGFYEYHT